MHDVVRQILIDLLVKILVDGVNLVLPEFFGQTEEFLHVYWFLKTLKIECVLLRHKPDWCALGNVLPITSADDPVQHSCILPKTRPDKLVLSILAEPVHMEDLRQIHVCPLSKVQPMLQVVSKVVAKERPHGKWIMHDHLGCGGRNGKSIKIYSTFTQLDIIINWSQNLDDNDTENYFKPIQYQVSSSFVVKLVL